jgi:hypothetical protein
VNDDEETARFSNSGDMGHDVIRSLVSACYLLTVMDDMITPIEKHLAALPPI